MIILASGPLAKLLLPLHIRCVYVNGQESLGPGDLEAALDSLKKAGEKAGLGPAAERPGSDRGQRCTDQPGDKARLGPASEVRFGSDPDQQYYTYWPGKSGMPWPAWCETGEDFETPEEYLGSARDMRLSEGLSSLFDRIDSILDVILDDKPLITGLLGYDEGAAVAASYLLYKEGASRIESAIFIHGWPAHAVDGSVVFADQTEKRVDIKSIHVVGVQGTYSCGGSSAPRIDWRSRRLTK